MNSHNYACFDDLALLSPTHKCSNVGLFKHNENVLTDFVDYLETRREQSIDPEGEVLEGPYRGLLWSHELGLSASEYMEDLDGCPIWQPNLLDDGNQHDYLREIASFDDHIRFTVYPERFRWSDAKEAVWDWLLDDSSPNFDRRHALLENQFDSIGIACNCHKYFEEFCVIELGRNVRPLKTNYFTFDSLVQPLGLGLDQPQGIYPGINQNYTSPAWRERERTLDTNHNLHEEEILALFGDNFPFPNWWVEYQENYWEATHIGTELVDFDFIMRNLQFPNLFKIKSFGLPNEPYCRTSRVDGFCAQDDPEPLVLQTSNQNQILAQGLFYYLEELRQNSYGFINDYITIPWAQSEIEENWGSSYESLVWNEALARAGRQLLNEEGACGTFGDANSDYFIDILRKYYAYEYQDVQTLRVVSPNLVNWNDLTDSP